MQSQSVNSHAWAAVCWSVEGALLRVRVEPPEQVRSRHLLELDGRDHAQDLIPLRNDNLHYKSRGCSVGRALAS